MSTPSLLGIWQFGADFIADQTNGIIHLEDGQFRWDVVGCIDCQQILMIAWSVLHWTTSNLPGILSQEYEIIWGVIVGSTNWGDWGSCYGRIAVAVIGGGNLWCKLGSLSKLRENLLRISTTNRTRLHGTNQDVRRTKYAYGYAHRECSWEQNKQKVHHTPYCWTITHRRQKSTSFGNLLFSKRGRTEFTEWKRVRFLISTIAPCQPKQLYRLCYCSPITTLLLLFLLLYILSTSWLLSDTPHCSR